MPPTRMKNWTIGMRAKNRKAMKEMRNEYL